MDVKEQLDRLEAKVRAELPVLAAEVLKMYSDGHHDGGRFRELARELTGVQPETRLDLVINMVKRASMEAVVDRAEQKGSAQSLFTEDDVAQLIGQGYILSGKGQKDRPLYLLDLARRLAITINQPKMAARCEELAAEVRSEA